MSEWEPPDGGYGWIVTAASFLLMFLYVQPACTFGLYFADLVEYHDTSITKISLIGSLQLATGPLSGVFIGILIDRYGCQAIAIFGGLLMCFAACMSSWLKHIYVLYVTYGVLLSIGAMCLQTTAVVCTQRYFTTKRARASSIGILGLSMGSFLWPPLTQFLIDRYRWHGAMLIFGAIYLHGIPLGWLLKHTPISKRKAIESANMSFLKTCRRMFDFSLLKRGTFVLYLCANVFISTGHVIPYIYLPIHSKNLHYSNQASAFLISVIGINGLIFRFLAGWLADRQCVRRIVMYGLAGILAGLAIILQLFTVQYYQLAIMASVFAFFAAGYISTSSSILVDILGVEAIAKSMGLYSMAGGIGNLIAQPLAGFLLDHFGSTHSVFIFGGGVQMTGGFLAFVSFLVYQHTKNNNDHDSENIDMNV